MKIKQKWQKHLRKVIRVNERRFRVTVEEPADWFVTHNAFSKRGKRRITIPKRKCPNSRIDFLIQVQIGGRSFLQHLAHTTYHERKSKYNTVGGRK